MKVPMKLPLFRSITALLAFFFVFAGQSGQAAGVLTLEEYLQQIQQKNGGFQSARASSAGGLARSHEGSLVLSPTLFSEVRLSRDDSYNLINPGFTGVINNYYTVGIRQQTSFGLSGTLSYDLNYYSAPRANLHEQIGHPQIQLTQSLWRNGFGSEAQAGLALAESSALASHFGQSYAAKNILADAETVYWRLSLARENVLVQKDAVERAQRTYDYQARRARLHLTDDSDSLQASAAFETRKLLLQSATDEERSAQRAFNFARGAAVETVAEEVSPLDIELVTQLTPPKREGVRDDVKAAEQTARSTAANAQLGIDRDSPTLDIYGSYALSGYGSGVGTAIGDSFKSDYPTKAIGVRFSTPLAVGAGSGARRGWILEREAADVSYQRKLLEQEYDWNDLNQRFTDAQRSLKLARSIEVAQGKKLNYERGRLTRGRTTTLQVLIFEQDLASAQFARMQSEAAVLQILARMKTFGGLSL